MHDSLDSSDSPIWVELNQLDLFGRSPLMLAHRLKNHDAIRVLCDHGASPKFKPFPWHPSPYELAIIEKDREMLKVYIQAN